MYLKTAPTEYRRDLLLFSSNSSPSSSRPYVLVLFGVLGLEPFRIPRSSANKDSATYHKFLESARSGYDPGTP